MKKLLLLLLSATAITIANAQITWNFSVPGGPSGVPANLSASGNPTPGANNGSTTFTTNGTPSSALQYAGASGNANGSCSAKPGLLNAPAGGSTYIQTVITPAANFWVSITAIKWGNFSLSTTGPTTLSVFASNDNFATSTLLGTASVGYSATTWTLVNPTITPYNGLTGTAVTVRIVASGGTGLLPATGAVNWRMDDLAITATAQTGVVGQIPKYTSPTTFGNSSITDNGTTVAFTTPLTITGSFGAGNKTIDVLTSSPTGQATFNLTNATAQIANFFKASAGYSTYKMIKGSDGGFYNGSSAGDLVFLNDFASGKIIFAAGGSSTAQATLLANGNLGVGTTAPAQKLDVAGGIKFSGLLVTSQPTNPAGLAGQVLQSNGPVNPPTWVNGATGTVTAIGVTTANGVSGTSSGGTTPNLTISLGAITPSSVNASGTVTGSNLSGINTGDNAPNTLYAGLVSNANHTGDASGATVLTLATVNSNVGTFTNPTFTVNAKGLVTAAANGVPPVTVETDPVVRAISGLIKSNGSIISPAVAGTDYLRPDGSAALLTNFPILNQNTTGNAATATTATNLAGGVAGSIPYQSAVGTTSMTAAGTTGYVLTSTGAGAPTWTNPASLPTGNDWTLSGNALPPASNSFLGTTTNNDLVLKVNNIESGRLNDANGNTYFGVDAAGNSTGIYTTATGKGSAKNNTGDLVTANGAFAAANNTGYALTAIGLAAGNGNTGTNVTAVGHSAAGTDNTGSNVTAVGDASAAGNTGDFVTAIGNNAAFINTGSNVVAVGENAANENVGNNVAAVGRQAADYNTGNNVVALGISAAAHNTHNNIAAIGANATVSIDNAISLGGINGINGATADVNVGIGTTAPTEKLHIQNGTIRIANGTEGAGKILTSDANGVANWADAPTPATTAWDLLGNAGTNPANNFIGTTDANDLVLKVNNIESGRLNDANANTYFGVSAANNNTGNNTTAIGKMAAFGNSGASSTAVGELAGYQNTGILLTAIGDIAAFGNTGGYLTALGFSAGGNNTGLEVTAIGGSAGNGNTGDHLTATGTASGAGNTGANVTGTGYFAGAFNSGSYLAATGYQAAYQNTGQTFTATGSYAGYTNTGDYSTALGFKAGYANTNSNSTAIGAFATVTVDNAISLGGISGINGAYADVNVGIGTTAPVAKLDVIGSVKITDGSEGAGKVLTSDANGLATWADPAGNNAWNVQGNSGTNPTDNFIGTTDNNDLVFKVNNVPSGRLNSSEFNTSFGILSADKVVGVFNGNYNTALGYQAAYRNTGSNVTATGFSAASHNPGFNITATGAFAAQDNIGNNVTANGDYAAHNNAGNEVTAVGGAAAENNSGSNITAIGNYAAEFNSGNNVVTNGPFSAQSNTGNNLTANGAYAAQFNTGINVTSIGYKAAVNNTHNNITAIGAYATVTVDNAISLGGINGINGATADVKVGIGTTAPSEKLHIQNGKIKIVDGTQGLGKVLTSDANGVASWADAPATGTSGWGLSGNAGTDPAINFIGTTDDNDLVFKVNGYESGRITSLNNNAFFGGLAGISNAGSSVTAMGYNAANTNTGDAVVAIGFQAGYLNTGVSLTATGSGAGYQNTGGTVTGTGTNAAFFNTGNNLTATGADAGSFNSGLNVTATGNGTARNNVGNVLTAAGHMAAVSNTGNNVVAIGEYAGNHNTGNDLTVIGSQAGANNSGAAVTASGEYAAYANTGNGLTANGFQAGINNVGEHVTAIGFMAASQNQNNNATALGAFATVTADNAISLGSIIGVNGATADAKVGIGTSAPSEKLHIQNGKIRIVDGTQGAGKVLTSDANGVASWQPAAFGKSSVSAENGLTINGSNIGLGSALNQATAITNNGFGLTIKGSKAATTFSSDGNLFSSGKIAIGTTDLEQIGNYSLAVNGAAIFTKASVKLIGNWPDYVFEPTYKLTALSEVEKFIADNKHLPGVPSATEIQKEGIDLGANQAILLKKVEELTLYTIEANKKIEQQQAQINALIKQQQATTELQQQKNK